MKDSQKQIKEEKQETSPHSIKAIKGAAQKSNRGKSRQHPPQTSLKKDSDLYGPPPVGHFTFNKDGLILDVNLTGGDQLGISRNRLIERSFPLYVTVKDRGTFQRYLSSLFEMKGYQSCEIKIRSKTASFRTHLESVIVAEAEGMVSRTSLIDLSDGGPEEKQHSSSRFSPGGKSLPRDHQKADYRRLVEEKLSKKKNIPPKVGSFKEMEKVIHELELHRIELQVQNEDLRATQAALETSRNSYAELYDSAPVGYFTFNEKGIVLHANLTGAAQLGMERNGIVGTPFTIYAAAADRRPFYEHLREVFKNRSRHRSEIKMNRSVKGGKHRTVVPFYAELESVYFETPQSRRECRTILTDITRRKETEEVLRKMNEGTQQKNTQLEETGRARHRFFSFISHELKTPLNSILGFTQLLLHGSYGPLTPEQKKAMVRLKISGGEMVHLINNILDAAKIEMEKSALQRIDVYILDLLEEVSLSFEPLLIEKKLLFEMQVNPATPKTFYTDREKVRSIVTNLLSNAVKFTRQGRIRLTVAPLPGEGGIRLAVSDTGIGIDPEHMERIFQEYEQSGFVRENPVRYASGTGLGLSIVKQMVSLLGGTVAVESDVGKGSTFTVVLFDCSSEKGKRFFEQKKNEKG